MGLSLEEFQQGAASVGNVIGQATTLWNQISGKTSVATPTTQSTQAATPSAPATTATTQGISSGLASIPPWMFLAGGVALLWVLSGRRR